MPLTRLSRLQRRILRYVFEAEARSGWSVSSSHYDLVRALGGNKGNLSISLRNLESKGLVQVYRTSGGKAESVWLTPEGKNDPFILTEVLNKGKLT